MREKKEKIIMFSFISHSLVNWYHRLHLVDLNHHLGHHVYRVRDNRERNDLVYCSDNNCHRHRLRRHHRLKKRNKSNDFYTIKMYLDHHDIHRHRHRHYHHCCNYWHVVQYNHDLHDLKKIDR
jgi:hypothetical protein